MLHWTVQSVMIFAGQKYMPLSPANEQGVMCEKCHNYDYILIVAPTILTSYVLALKKSPSSEPCTDAENSDTSGKSCSGLAT